MLHDVSTLRWVDDTPFVYNNATYYQPWLPAEYHHLGDSDRKWVRMKGSTSGEGRWAAHQDHQSWWAVCETSTYRSTYTSG